MQQVINRKVLKVALVSEQPETALGWKARVNPSIPIQFKCCTPGGFEGLKVQGVVVDGVQTLSILDRRKLPIVCVERYADPILRQQAFDLGAASVCEDNCPIQLGQTIRETLTRPNSSTFDRRMYDLAGIRLALGRLTRAERKTLQFIRLKVSPDGPDPMAPSPALTRAVERRIFLDLPDACRVVRRGRNDYFIAVHSLPRAEIFGLAQHLNARLTKLPLALPYHAASVQLSCKISHLASHQSLAEIKPKQTSADHSLLEILQRRSKQLAAAA